jgi:putative Holliday junction resolvase
LKYIALDVGERRVGIAVTDDAGIIVRPLITLATENSFLERLGEVIEEEKPDKVVFGLPRHQNGDIGGMAKQIREIAKGVKHEYNIEVDFEDESGTTVMAEERMRDAGVALKDMKTKVDAEAATVILESYLARKKSRK